MVLDTNFQKKLFAFSENSLELSLRQKLMAGWEVVTSFYIAFFRIKIKPSIDVLYFEALRQAQGDIVCHIILLFLVKN
jgi:hypothetical protein